MDTITLSLETTEAAEASFKVIFDWCRKNYYQLEGQSGNFFIEKTLKEFPELKPVLTDKPNSAFTGVIFENELRFLKIEFFTCPEYLPHSHVSAVQLIEKKYLMNEDPCPRR